MIVQFDKSFIKSLERTKDQSILKRIEAIIIKAEAAGTINDLPNVKKLTGYTLYYRIKIGNYRLGFEKINTDTIRLITIAHRKDIYKKFP